MPYMNHGNYYACNKSYKTRSSRAVFQGYSCKLAQKKKKRILMNISMLFNNKMLHFTSSLLINFEKKSHNAKA